MGERMKFDREDPRQGVFFVEQDTRVAFRAKTIGRLQAARMTLEVPAGLTANKLYRVEVRTVSENDASRELRVGRLSFAFSATEK